MKKYGGRAGFKRKALNAKEGFISSLSLAYIYVLQV
jgi:hypothetical protein